MDETTVWNGGGLADIVANNSDHIDGVTFVAFPFDDSCMDVGEDGEKKGLHVIIHKLTENLVDENDVKIK